MPTNRLKVYVYLTNGISLLVFRHPDFPEAGIQVPGGSVEPGEPLVSASLREVVEETGLSGLTDPQFLGVQSYNFAPLGRDEVHQRYYYHYQLAGSQPATWRHYETNPSDRSPRPIAFEFYWVDLRGGDPELIAELDAFLPRLKTRLGLR